MRHTTKIFAQSLLAIGVAATSPAFAQQLQIEEVVVTAQKRSESVQDIPSTVNAVSGEALDEYKVFNFSDVAALTPGLSLDSATSRSAAISMRGISFNPDANASPAVDMYWNGIIARAPDVFSQMFDIERLEILRGPQGTLQGKTSPGGSIQIYTRRPSFDEYEGTIELTLNDNGGFNTRFGMSLPVSDTFAVRIAGVYDESDLEGIENINTGAKQSGDTSGARITLDWVPSDNFSALLVSEYLKSTNDGPEDVVGTDLLGNGWPTLGDYDRKALSYINPKTVMSHDYHSLRMDWDVAGHQISSVTGYRDSLSDDYRDRDVSGSVPGGLLLAPVTDFSLFVQELRLTSLDPGFWEYIVGLYYDKGDSQTDVDLGGSLWVDTPRDNETYGVFTHNKFHLSDFTTLQLGLRWSRYNLSYRSDLYVGDILVNEALTGDNTGSDEDEITGTLKLSHHFSDDFMLYGSLDRGYRPGGSTIAFSPIAPELLTFDGETSHAAEFGFKSTLLDGRARLNAALYYQEFDGYIARITEPAFDTNGDDIADGNVTGGVTYNGDATVRGGEFDFTYLISEDWTLGGGASYNDAKFDSADVLCNVPGPDGSFIILDGNPTTGPGAIASCNSSGRIGSEPNLSATVNSEYTFPLDNTEVYLRGLVKYNGARALDDVVINGESGDLPDYTVVNLYAGFRDQGGAWDVSIWATNLFDKEALSDQRNLEQGGATGYRKVTAIQERMIGITAQYNFSL